MNETVKFCKRCSTAKPAEMFYVKNINLDGRDNYCKECRKPQFAEQYQRSKVKKYEKTKEWREKNKQRYLDGLRNYNIQNPDKARHKAELRYSRLIGNGGRHTAKEWKDLKDYYGNKCLCCGSMENIEKDHVVPLAKGGTNDISNLQPLCAKCNDSKNIKTIDYRIK